MKKQILTRVNQETDLMFLFEDANEKLEEDDEEIEIQIEGDIWSIPISDTNLFSEQKKQQDFESAMKELLSQYDIFNNFASFFPIYDINSERCLENKDLIYPIFKVNKQILTPWKYFNMLILRNKYISRRLKLINKYKPFEPQINIKDAEAINSDIRFVIFYAYFNGLKMTKGNFIEFLKS